MNVNYVADHIVRIEGIHSGYPQRILNSKWRIASNVDLFPYGELAVDGSLTPDQIAEVDAYIESFKSTPAGRESLALYAGRVNG